MKFCEGLEVLGTDERPDDNAWFYGIFGGSVIEHVELPSTLRRIEYNVFEGCRNLKDISLPEGLTYIGERCFMDSALESIAIPAKLSKVDSSAFTGCERLKRVEFLEGRTTFGTVDDGVWNAIFKECNVEEVTLPSTLLEISPKVFEGCDSLMTVRVARDCPVDVEGLVGSRVKVKRK